MNLFLLLWAIFALLNPDCESGSGYTGTPFIPDTDPDNNTGINKYIVINKKMFFARAGLGHYRVQGAERAVQGNAHHRVRHLLQAVPLPERHEEPLRVPLQAEGQVSLSSLLIFLLARFFYLVTLGCCESGSKWFRGYLDWSDPDLE